jgi:zinc transporter 5/7
VLEELHRQQHFVQAGALSAAALLLIGTIARLRLSDTVLDRRKHVSAGSTSKIEPGTRHFSFDTIRTSTSRMLSIALPFYGSVQLGGVRVALVLLLFIATGLSNVGINANAGVMARMRARPWAVAPVGALLLLDGAGLLGNYTILDLFLGYMALFTSASAIPPPIPYLDRLLGRYMPIITTASAISTPVVPTPPATPRPSGSPRKDAPVSKLADANASIISGSILAIATAGASFFFRIPLNLSPIHAGFSVLSLATIAGLTFFALPITIGSKGKPGLASSLLITGVFAFIQTNEIYGFTLIPFFFAAFCIASYFVALQYSAPDFGHFRESKRRKRDHSIFTAYLLSYCAPGSMLDTILSERDSRRIAYFAWYVKQSCSKTFVTNVHSASISDSC